MTYSTFANPLHSRALVCLFAFVSVLCILMATINPSYASDTPMIAVVDMQMVLKEANAAKDARTQIKALKDKYLKDIKQQEAALQKTEKELKTQRSLLAPDAFEAKRKDFNTQLSKIQQDIQNKRTSIDQSLNKALSVIQMQMTKIIAAMAQKQSFDIALPRSQVLYAHTKLDITKDVLKQLDETLPKIPIKP